MATDLQSPKPSAATKYEAFVEEQLGRAQTRIRLLDLSAAALGLAAITLAYTLFVSLADRWLDLPPMVRQAAFTLYLLSAAAYAGLVIVWPLCRRLNPYYAARRIEESLPGVKNSVVNWLDLRRESLPAAVQVALGHRAAKDLAKADLEQAIKSQRTSWLGGIVFGLVLGLAVLFVLGPRQFFSLLSRAFSPFVEASIATRTNLTLLRPEGGDVTVPVGRAVSFAVYVEGKVPDPSRPDALRLLFRHNPGDPDQERALERGDSGREWGITIPAQQVHNGFWYRIVGGDASTPEYRVQVRSTPLVTGFDVTYRYRKYLGWKDETQHDPNLKAPRGTEVVLVARTNRIVQSGQLAMDNEPPIAGERVGEDLQSLRFKLVLEKDTSYRIWFVSREGERNTDPMPYTIRILLDRPPQAEVSKPGNVQMAANGVLTVEGSASDDYGVASMTLRMQVKEGPVLQPKPYRAGKSFRLPDGSYPQMLEYRDSVELDQVTQENGQPFKLQPGMEIKYWLEATDNCDYPGPNVGRSEEFTLLIDPPAKDKAEQQKEREQNREQQKQHEEKQDQRLDEEARKKEEDKSKDGKQDEPKKEGDKKEGDQDQELERKADKLREAIEKSPKKEQGDSSQEKSKPPDQPPKDGEPKEQLGDPKKDEAKQKEGDPSKQRGEKSEPGDNRKQDTKPKQGDPSKQDENPGQKSEQAKEKEGQRKQQDRQAKPEESSRKEGDGQQKQETKGKQADDRSKEGDGRPQGEQDPAKQGADQRKEGDGRQEKAGGQSQRKDAQAKKGDEASKADGQQKAEGQRKETTGKSKQEDGPNKQDGRPDKTEPSKNGEQPKEGDPGTKKSRPGEDKGGKQLPDKSSPDQSKKGEPEKIGEPKKGESEGAEPGTEQTKDGNSKTAERKPGEPKKGESKKSGSEKKEPGKADSGQDKPKGSEKGNDPSQPKMKEGDSSKGGDSKKDEPNKGESKGGEPKAGAPKEGESASGQSKPGQANSKKSKSGEPKDGKNPKEKGDGEKGRPASSSNPGKSGQSGAKGGSEPNPEGEKTKEGDATEEPGKAEGSDAAKGETPDPAHKKRAGTMQLDDIRKRVNKDVLKNANMTEEEYQRFLKAYEEMLRRKQPVGDDKETLPAPYKGGAALPSQSARQVQPGQTDKPGLLQRSGPALPPPPFRDVHREFSRKLSELERAREKK